MRFKIFYRMYHTIVWLRVLYPSEIAVLDHCMLLELIGQNGLWEIFAMHLQAVSNALFTHTLQLSTSNSFEIVRNQLIEPMNEPKLLRDSLHAEKYIRSKTGKSRSGTMHILSEMKMRGFITMENEMLKSINCTYDIK
ncbi:helix-turn-helix domain-containing protein [Buttiauxella agrestis]|uniref:helix-turn-helix domain-containing protein n=1 Tax=Buttiauxella agrestis TaxID=82977 RepID=UPI001560BB87|nr:helix-turn-helix domain-containing protein [Buttiauxella agrestis]